MAQRSIVLAVMLSMSWLVLLRTASAEMAPCRLDDPWPIICGSGNGAAQVIYKTVSPSKRYAFAWRLTDRPPTAKPDESDPNLENFVIRIEDGKILARSRGSYWDLGTKIAKAYLFTAWSPDSSLLVKVEQRDESSSAEFFAFAGDDRTIGPFELADVIKSALLAKIDAIKEAESDHLVFFVHPKMTIDNEGVLRAWVRVEDNQEQHRGSVYEISVQLKRSGDSLSAEVISAIPSKGPFISIIVH